MRIGHKHSTFPVFFLMLPQAGSGASPFPMDWEKLTEALLFVEEKRASARGLPLGRAGSRNSVIFSPIAFGHMGHAAFGVVPPFNPNGMVKLFPKGAELPFRFIRLFQRKMFHGDDRILARAVDSAM